MNLLGQLLEGQKSRGFLFIVFNAFRNSSSLKKFFFLTKIFEKKNNAPSNYSNTTLRDNALRSI